MLNLKGEALDDRWPFAFSRRGGLVSPRLTAYLRFRAAASPGAGWPRLRATN